MMPAKKKNDKKNLEIESNHTWPNTQKEKINVSEVDG